MLDASYTDAVVALGASPVAVSFAGSEMEALPWLADVVDPAVVDPSLSSNEGVNFEAVAAAQPDLIIGAWWLIDDAAYGQLSGIAPTVAGRTDGNDGWEARLEVAAEALGLTDRVEAVRADVAASYADLAARVPGLAGLTDNYTGFGDDIGFFYGNGSWLEPLGLVPDDDQDNSQQAAPLSFEQMDQIDADVWAIWPTSDEMRTTIESDGRFARQHAVADGIVIWLDRPLANATNGAGPLSLQWTVEQLAPVVVAQAEQLDG